MDRITRAVLHFNHFTLDLARGCLRRGSVDIELPPKPFAVLRHLAENAGRLVSKDELHDAVWRKVTVADDSLVQCIRELRQKLGDDSHRLIKTVPRRGYMLDTTLVDSPVCSAGATPVPPSPEQPEMSRRADAAGWTSCALALFKPHRMMTAAVLCLTVAAAYLLTIAFDLGQKRVSVPTIALLPLSPSPASELITANDLRRVASLAIEKQLPLPPFVIRKPARHVPASYRRFIGVWTSHTGWPRSGRQFMLIVTAVDAAGVVEGYVVDGPPQLQSRDQGPARFAPFLGRAVADALHFGSTSGERIASLTADNQVEFRRTWRDGGASSLTLSPTWTLIEAERASERKLADNQ
jgi:DNA-binding winged helix-turn-helix (wHTH) protein